MRIKYFCISVIIYAAAVSTMYSQTADSVPSKKPTLSHCFNIGTSFIFGKQFHEYDKLTTPYNFNLGYDVQFNFGKHFILQTGIQYTYKPYIFNLRYLDYDTTTSSLVNGLDELNVQYHSLYFRVRPGVRFKVGNIYETSIVVNLFYGFNILGNYSHRNLTPQYSYTLFTGGVEQEKFSHYWGGGPHWINLFKISPRYSIGLDIGYNFYVNYYGLNELFYNSSGLALANPHPMMNNNALVINFLFKFK
jgi:hypothetical protein